MSTPNFYNRKANYIFATKCEDELDYEDLIENVRSSLNCKAVDKYENNGLRSYEGNIFAEIEKTIGKWAIVINLIVRGGYYGGMNIDWGVEIEDTSEGDSFEWGENKISNTADNYIQKQIGKIEKTYRNFTEPLICLGVFSNGEAVYERASKFEAVPAT